MTEDTANFSKTSDFINNKLTIDKQVCPIHKLNLVSAFGKEPLCYQCGLDAIKKKDEELANKSYENYIKNKTYNCLERDSIFLDKTLLKADFDSYQTKDEETISNKDKALKIAREYYQGADYNTVLTGNPGTGKSHLAMSMLKVVNGYSDPYRKCLFVSIDEVLRKIRGTFNNRDSKYTEQYVVDLLTSADLLVIDDLGAEIGAVGTDKQASDFVSKILYSIVNGRMDKPTIITTNLSSKELARTYDNKLISRLFRGSAGHVIKFESTSDKRIGVEF